MGRTCYRCHLKLTVDEEKYCTRCDAVIKERQSIGKCWCRICTKERKHGETCARCGRDFPPPEDSERSEEITMNRAHSMAICTICELEMLTG